MLYIKKHQYYISAEGVLPGRVFTE